MEEEEEEEEEQETHLPLFETAWVLTLTPPRTPDSNQDPSQPEGRVQPSESRIA